jgi:outer membrane lipoprotein-sorting protein
VNILGKESMEKQTVLFGIIATLACSLLIVSGCTQQNNSPSPESLQAILEKASIIESVYYELEISQMINGSVEQSTTMKIWQKTPYLKEEVNSTTAGITTTLIVIKRPEGIYRYDTSQNTYALDPLTVIPQLSTADMVNDLQNNQTLTILGIETIDGMTATVIQYTPSQAGNSTTIKMWIWNEKGVLLKALYTTVSEEANITMDYNYSNYSFSDIPNSTFSVE